MSSVSPLIVFTSVTRSFTNCAMSLSPVDTTTFHPASPAISASVPITSSASTCGITSTGQPISRTKSGKASACGRKSSGIGGRVAL